MTPLIPLTPMSLEESYAWCEDIARVQAANFYPAFRLLPRPQRRAMCALYAFMRFTDDLSDDDRPVEDRRASLLTWRAALDGALAGQFCHPIHPALADTVRTCAIPPVYLHDVLDGVSMDLDTLRYATFADLYRYCYRVASAVGLACIHIWGFRGEEAKGPAEAAGIALQLTNILRDVAEDAGRGRIYLPREDLARFGCREEEILRGELTAPLKELMRFEADRARGYYEAARELEARLAPPGRAVFRVMTGIYRGLLDEIVRRDYDVFRERVRLSRWRKLWLAARALPVRFARN